MRFNHVLVYLITQLFLTYSDCYSQVLPQDIINSLKYHQDATKLESERKSDLLDLTGLLRMLDNTTPKVFIDLRGARAYQKEHLKGAINLPMEELTEAKLKELVPDLKTPIIIYCDNSFFPTRMIPLTTYGYPTLRKFGYENVYEVDSLWRDQKLLSFPRELEPYWEKKNNEQK